MAKKKKGGKKKGGKGKKSAGPAEPPHDPQWEGAVQARRWDRPPDALPDAALWPTWGAIRERILSACKVVRVTYSPSMRDSFPAEIVRLAPPELERLELKGASLLTRVVVSPAAALPALSRLDLGSCPALEFVQVQSDSLTHLNLSRCTGLKKALVQCRNLRSIDLECCAELETLMLWSDELSELKLETCEELRALKLYAARLQGDEPRAQGRLVLPHGGRLRPPKGAPAPSHPPIAGMLKDLRWQAQLDAQAVEERDRGMSAPAAGVVPKPYVRSY